MKRAFALAIIFGFLLCVSPAGGVAGTAVPEGSLASVDQMLSVAEKQHEIARLLIKEGRFERVLPEMRKILDLNLTGDYEQAVAKSSSFIAYLLVEHKQYAIGHQLLDETIKKMRLDENIASLLKIKAYLFKAEGKLGNAIETLERSVELEQK
jgi:tetratricopeptide (TPR) repeat protein